MFDARRMEVYVMVLDENKQLVKPTFNEVITSNSFEALPNDTPWIFMGEGALKCQKELDAPQIQYRTDIGYPSAQEMVGLAWQSYQKKEFEDVAYFEPFYLKDFYTTAKKKGV
jgi:tRNA threonylcarbamoyladenosine biosynthesis protein TsaB